MFGLSRSLLSDLPWDTLVSQLSSSAELIDGSPEKFLEECVPLFRAENYPLNLVNGSQYDLNAPNASGLCMNTMFCGYERCDPSDSQTLLAFLEDVFEPTYLGTNPEIIEDLLVPENSRFNLPFKVLHPRTAGDVAAAVAFADEHGVEVSVKNSGHHYAGASMNKDSLLIYTQSYRKYSDTSIEACSTQDEEEAKDDLSNMPCKLALARGKPAAIRVGGGENWNDVYFAVKRANEDSKSATGGYLYHVVGGGAATVTPMGWTWQGGLGGTALGRKFGFGVDQVLQIEMILPDGSHAKFGPTDWAIAEGYASPRTTEVSGVCNNNPSEEDEEKWEWGPCANSVNFDDLWFALRGGGGGTWGVVLSVHLQLHDYPGKLQEVGSDRTFDIAVGECLARNETAEKCDEYRAELMTLFANFLIDFYHNPAALNVTQEHSDLCASPDTFAFFCYDGAGHVVVSAWNNLVLSSREMLAEQGVPDFMIDIAAENSVGLLGEADDYAVTLLGKNPNHPDKGDDAPRPSPQGYTSFSMNALIPKALLLKNRDDWIPVLAEITPPLSPYFAHADGRDDQASSLSDAHRSAAFMISFLQDEPPEGTVLELLFGDVDQSADAGFPGFLGSNHLGPNTMGPLKSNWTKPCPVDWTWERRAEECISPLEAVYGTERLKRLERIKYDVDPKHLFRCNTCIEPAAAAAEPTSAPSGATTTEPTSAPSGAVKGAHCLFATLTVMVSIFVAAL